MQKNSERLLASAVVSALAVAVIAAARGRLEARSAWTPINAISHMWWGSGAGTQQGFTMRYTGLGLLLNGAACGVWAWVYARGRNLMRRPLSATSAAFSGIGVSALAYLTDYYVVPRRFTPGFELSLSRRSFPWLYGALAAGLMLPDLAALRGNMRRNRA